VAAVSGLADVAKSKTHQYQTLKKKNYMLIAPMFAAIPMFAAADYSLIYLLGGGGLIGVALIFIIAKMVGK